MATDKNDITSTTIASDQQVRESAGKTYSSVGDTTNVFLASVRTYVAGILMPTIAVSISASFNAYPTARITMPADPRLFNLGNHDRVPVQIFVKETMVECPNYVLMFEGFVAGRSYISVANQREINLECVSFVEVFKDTKLRFMTSIQEQFLSSVPGNREVAQGIFLPGFMFQDVPLHACLFAFPHIGRIADDEVVASPGVVLVLPDVPEAEGDVHPMGEGVSLCRCHCFCRDVNAFHLGLGTGFGKGDGDAAAARPDVQYAHAGV